MGVSSEQIADACVDSELVDVNEQKTKIRRTGNPALPELNTDRKRDAKAQNKSGGGAQAAAAAEEDIVGPDGRIILTEKDFDNP